MDTIMGNKFGKTIWLQRMIKMMDKIDNFRSKHWKTMGYKMIFITKNEFNIIWVDKIINKITMRLGGANEHQNIVAT